MSEEPRAPAGLTIHEARLYYDPRSGEVVHLHQLASAPGEELDGDRIDAEMNAFAGGLRERYGDLEYLTVEPDEVPALAEGARVDVQRRTVIRAEPSG